MNTLVLSDFNTSSASAEQIKVAKNGKKNIVTANFVLVSVCVVILAAGLMATAPWKASVYDRYKVSNDTIVAQLTRWPNEEFKVAAKHFDRGNYNEARQIVLKQFLRNLDDVKLAKQYAAMLIASDCFETSKQVLYPIFDSENLTDKAEAAYLLGLTFLKEGKVAGAKRWLAKVPKTSLQYHQAQDLIRELENS